MKVLNDKKNNGGENLSWNSYFKPEDFLAQIAQTSRCLRSTNNEIHCSHLIQDKVMIKMWSLMK